MMMRKMKMSVVDRRRKRHRLKRSRTTGMRKRKSARKKRTKINLA